MWGHDLISKKSGLCPHIIPKGWVGPAPFRWTSGSSRRPTKTQVSPQTMQLLLGYAWPGNVRELQNVIERAAVIAEGTIEPAHLPSYFRNEMKVLGTSERPEKSISLDDRLAEMEKGMIIEAMTRAGGVQIRAAQLLGINQRSLWHRIKKHNIDVPSLKKLQNM